MDNKEKIKGMNKPLFENGILPAEQFIAIIVEGDAIKTGSGDDATTIVGFQNTTKPTDAAIEAGVKPQKYYRVQFEPVGMVSTVDGIKKVRTKKKPYAHNVFANSQPNLFSVLDEMLEGYGKLDDAAKKAILEPFGKTVAGPNSPVRKKYKLKNAVFFGRYIVMNTPKYNPQERDIETGENKAFQAIKRDPKTGEYKKQDVTMSVFRFWADEDDLMELESVCETFYENRVLPFEVEVTTTVTKKGNEITQKTDEPVKTEPEEVIENQNE